MIDFSSLNTKFIVLVTFGSLAGFVDSIAGGGGLITLPLLTLVVGPGATAVGTNKIVGSLGALVALIVYLRHGHVDWGRSITFTFWVGVGSSIGSYIARFLPPQSFQWILFISCPIIVWIVWNKELWIKKELPSLPSAKRPQWIGLLEYHILLSGLFCGFYDGAWGPGGGTFMFLALLFFARLPLLSALAVSKLANFCSASVALAIYYTGGYVHWVEGLTVAFGMSMGAFVGARNANKNASKIVRPILLFLVSLLLIKLFLNL